MTLPSTRSLVPGPWSLVVRALSGLALLAALSPIALAAPQQTYFVDIDTAPANHNLRDGTSVAPFAFLAEALDRLTLFVGDTILVAGSRVGADYAGADGAYSYTPANPPIGEYFPIKVPAGVTIGYWESQSSNGPNSLPSSAVFRQDPVLAGQYGLSTNAPCFLVDAITGSGQVKVDFYHASSVPIPYPYVHPGIVITNFTTAVKIEVPPPSAHGIVNVLIKGAFFRDNTMAFEVLGHQTDDHYLLDVRRSLFLAASSAQANRPGTGFMNIQMNNGVLDLGITNSDFRTGQSTIPGDAIYGEAVGIGAVINLEATSVDISGASDYPPNPVVTNPIGQSGIHLEGKVGGMLHAELTDVKIQDTVLNGFWGLLNLPGPGMVRSRGTFRAESDCVFTLNGEDGVLLEANEGSVWDLVRFYEAKSHTNGLNGLALWSRAGGENSGFLRIDLLRSFFLQNGFTSSSGPGSGVWSNVEGSLMNAFIDRCRFSGNARSGVVLTQTWYDTYSSAFSATNSFFSLNQGLPTGGTPAAPLQLHYLGASYDPTSGVTCALVYNTFANNFLSGFGFVYDNSAHTVPGAWSPGSRIENSVFYNLGMGAAGDFAIFPPPGSGPGWTAIAETTRGCWIADPLGGLSAWYAFSAAAGHPNQNLIGNLDPNPTMDPFIAAGVNYGMLFPALGSVLVNAGIGPTPAFTTDHIGAPRGVGGANDIGCFERQQ